MKIAILGAGNMAMSLLAPLRDELVGHEVRVYTPTKTKAELLAKELNGQAVEKVEELRGYDTFVLGFKPQQMSKVSESLAGIIGPDSFVVSMLAGVSTKQIESQLGTSKVLRIMPNTPCSIGEGVISLFMTKSFDGENKDSWPRWFRSTGMVIEFDHEEMIDLTTPQLGSGPAFIFELARILSNSLVDVGVGQKVAEDSVAQMIFGASKLLKESSSSAVELRNQVTSKKGITEAALNHLKAQGLEKIFGEAIKAGHNRSKELVN